MKFSIDDEWEHARITAVVKGAFMRIRQMASGMLIKFSGLLLEATDAG
jgi:hypothetical protein